MNKKFIPPGMINNDEGLTENDFESDDIQDVISELLSINPDDQEGVNETKPPSPLKRKISPFQSLAEGLNTVEELNLYRLRDHLGISEDDAIWSIFVALQLHLKLYKQIPDAIRKETQRTIEQIHIPIFDAQKKAVKEIKEFKEQNTEEMVTVAKREAVGVGIQIGEKISALAYEANKLFKDASDDHQKHMNEALELHTKNLAEANDVYKEAITKLTKQTSNHLYAWVLKAAFQIFMLVFGVMTGVLLVNQFPGVLNFLKLLQI